MSLDVSDAIALAKDLLKTSGEFRTHDPGASPKQFCRTALSKSATISASIGTLIDERVRLHLLDEPAEEDGSGTAPWSR